MERCGKEMNAYEDAQGHEIPKDGNLRGVLSCQGFRPVRPHDSHAGHFNEFNASAPAFPKQRGIHLAGLKATYFLAAALTQPLSFGTSLSTVPW